jgi:hypothetical protein
MNADKNIRKSLDESADENLGNKAQLTEDKLAFVLAVKDYMKPYNELKVSGDLSSLIVNPLEDYRVTSFVAKWNNPIKDIISIVNPMRDITGVNTLAKLANPLRDITGFASLYKQKNNFLDAGFGIKHLGFLDDFYKNRSSIAEIANINKSLGGVGRFRSLANMETLGSIARMDTLSSHMATFKNVAEITLSVGRLTEALSSAIERSNIISDITSRSLRVNDYLNSIELQTQKVNRMLTAHEQRLLSKYLPNFPSLTIEEVECSPAEPPEDKFKALQEEFIKHFNTQGDLPIRSLPELLKDVRIAPQSEEKKSKQRPLYFRSNSFFYLRSYELYYRQYLLYALYLLLCLQAIKELN